MAQSPGRSLRIQVTRVPAQTNDVTSRASDERIIAAQLGRIPMGVWSVEVRCSYGWPTVIRTLPLLPDGSPFPTLYWLTCPWLKSQVDALESAGGTTGWAVRLASDSALSGRLLAADAEYRTRRAAAGGGCDPTPTRGIAGQRDPLATKCLHAHVASALAGIDDPLGLEVLAGLSGATCPDDVCAAADVTP